VTGDTAPSSYAQERFVNLPRVSASGDGNDRLLGNLARPEIRVAVASISVFFPCYNDATTIGAMVERVGACLDHLGVDGEIIVVNDASPDDAKAVLQALLDNEPRLRVVEHEHNRGYGGALKSGFSAATRDWVFYTDGDGQYDPGELELLVAHADIDVDVVQGFKLSPSTCCRHSASASSGWPDTRARRSRHTSRVAASSKEPDAAALRPSSASSS